MSDVRTSESIATATNGRESRQLDLLDRFCRVRGFSETICDPLETEDYVIQSMPDVSPTRWHMAHTTWFFETFVLKDCVGYRPYNDQFQYLFNSYYNTVGQQYPRDGRGLLSRPTVAEIFAYRWHVDDAVRRWIQANSLTHDQLDVVELGLNHEQQHQELMLTDIKHVLSMNPLYPIYRAGDLPSTVDDEGTWLDFGAGTRELGHCGEGFAFDNESPQHDVLLQSYSIASRLVTNGRYLEFINDGGYERPELWLSLGWNHVQQHGWQAPLYWLRNEESWSHFTLSGLQDVDASLPVCHVSFFEADAFARWAGYRLATEAEWESMYSKVDIVGNFADRLIDANRTVHPSEVLGTDDFSLRDQPLRDGYGMAWQWTSSPYVAYPRYRPASGALGEYNGKFMCNQFVLRGGSCATPSAHIRPSYRNFFPPETRWQFTGIRLADDR